MDWIEAQTTTLAWTLTPIQDKLTAKRDTAMSSTTILTSPHQGQEYIDGLVDERKELRLNGDYVGADAIYTELCALGVVLSDSVDGTTTWRWKADSEEKTLNSEEKRRKVKQDDFQSGRRRKQKGKRKQNKEKRNRFSVFAEWLLESFPNIDGIIDVAGGKGKLAWELCIVRNASVSCTVVDPCISKYGKYTSKYLIQRGIDSYDDRKDGNQENILPHQDHDYHMPSTLCCNDICDQLSKEMQISMMKVPVHQMLHIDVYNEVDSRSLWSYERFMKSMGMEFHRCMFSEDYCDMYIRDRIDMKNKKIIVGLHPDQVTEFIVEEALRNEMSFAIIPCCVYPSLFPDRHLDEGTAVRSYDQFIEYLMNKNKQIKKTVLKDMVGCNQVLYYHHAKNSK